MLKMYFWLNRKTNEVYYASERPSPDWKRIKRSEAFHRQVAAQQSVKRTGEQSTAAFDNSDLHSDDREDSNPLFFTRR